MTLAADTARPMTFFEELRLQRWDDHRYYHRSRINQSLHLLSALCFLGAYASVPFNPVATAMLGWVGAMVLRQTGHFFFEPKGYDAVNDATHEHKENIKVGYNLRRKVVLLSAWAVSPLVVVVTPTLFGLARPYADWHDFVHHVSVLWIALGAAGLLARTIWLCATRNVQTGLVWCSKILTDPFHDIALYYRSPLRLIGGEWLDPMVHARAPR